ncbi:MAG TPA: type II toxin-antitoxin system RelE/ParE family toxin [Asticcacaulis sp.]
MRLTWSFQAQNDRNRIFDYIEADNPRAAVAVDNAIREQIEHLTQYPQSGRAGRVSGTRERVVTGLPYLVVYRLLDDGIRILRIVHTSQLWPTP